MACLRDQSLGFGHLSKTIFLLLQLLNLLTFGLWSKVGRLTHYAFDAVISTYTLPSPLVSLLFQPRARGNSNPLPFAYSFCVSRGYEAIDRLDVSEIRTEPLPPFGRWSNVVTLEEQGKKQEFGQRKLTRQASTASRRKRSLATTRRPTSGSTSISASANGSWTSPWPLPARAASLSARDRRGCWKTKDARGGDDCCKLPGFTDRKPFATQIHSRPPLPLPLPPPLPNNRRFCPCLGVDLLEEREHDSKVSTAVCHYIVIFGVLGSLFYLMYARLRTIYYEIWSFIVFICLLPMFMSLA